MNLLVYPSHAHLRNHLHEMRNSGAITRVNTAEMSIVLYGETWWLRTVICDRDICSLYGSEFTRVVVHHHCGTTWNYNFGTRAVIDLSLRCRPSRDVKFLPDDQVLP